MTRITLLCATLLFIAGLLPAAATATTQSTPDSLLGPEIAISTLDNQKLLPAVAYNWKRHEYLVVWHNKWPGNRDIYAQRVSETGALLSWFAVSAGPKDRAQAAVAYDPVNDRYLVVWIFDALGNGSDWDVYGRFIPALGPDPALGEFPICDWTSSQWNPAVAYARAQEEFMVVWANQAAGVPWYISGRRVNAKTGAFPATGADVTIAHPTQDRVNPDVAYNLARNEYLVVWEQAASSQDIWALRMTGTAVPLGGGEFNIAGWPDHEERPAVAACAAQDQYLVAWQSDVGTGKVNYDLYAWYLDGAGGKVGGPLVVDATSSPEENVDIACSFGETAYLLAWQARYTNLKYGIAARMAFPSGTLAPGYDLAPAYEDRTQPGVAGGHANFLVAWEHERGVTGYQDIRGRLFWPEVLFMPFVRR
jgi:hypothetical protein